MTGLGRQKRSHMDKILSAVNVLPVDVHTQAEDNCIIDAAIVLVASRWTAAAGLWPRRGAGVDA
jgi:hypothetical protein